ncbi:hypothetical protein TB1_035903 [Malus domestica]|uniref:Uncharacterized protein n=1 Tax=Malus domestica TaxID=3750 RepID=A0A498JVQ4_MALDO|nr:uncharacterized protein LOC103434935 [Malus domestica]RXH99037.1 hypothetical protein DVH24_011362 [Malus domestica]
MAKTTPSHPTLLFLTLLRLTTAQPSQSFSYSLYPTLFSLAHSLMTRVANLREARGDVSGSQRARAVSSKLERGLGMGVWGFMWSAGWDDLRNYARRDFPYSEVDGAVADANELLRWLGDLTQRQSDSDRAVWVAQNYQTILKVSNSLLRRLLKVLYHSETLREMVKAVQREVVEGELLGDCLVLGSNDLNGVIQILKDLGSQYGSTTPPRTLTLLRAISLFVACN